MTVKTKLNHIFALNINRFHINKDIRLRESLLIFTSSNIEIQMKGWIYFKQRTSPEFALLKFTSDDYSILVRVY